MPDHLGIDATDARIALIMGAPERVVLLASCFDRPAQLTSSRGFLIYEGFIQSHKLLFVSSGIGGPSTAIAIEELIDLGIEVIVRVGTCGALHPYIKPGDIVISSGVVRKDGTSKQYVDPAFPAVPDPLLLCRLLAAAKANDIPYHLGITHCKDAYYMEKPGKQLMPQEMTTQWNVWRKANVLATEMEAAILFVLGSIRKISTAALFINVGKVRDPHTATLERIVLLLKEVLPAAVAELPIERHVAGLQDKDVEASFLDNDDRS